MSYDRVLIKPGPSERGYIVLNEERERIEVLEGRRARGEAVDQELDAIYEAIRVRNNLDASDTKDKRALDGLTSLFRLAPPDLQRTRLATCRTCENARKLGPGLRPEMAIIQCKLCNCIMNAKTKLASATCPAGRF